MGQVWQATDTQLNRQVAERGERSGRRESARCRARVWSLEGNGPLASGR